MPDFDVLIIGGGPAGLTAGIYCARRKLRAAIIERMGIGGQMLLASEIGNWPGEKSISGSKLADRMDEHAKSVGVEFVFDEALALKLDDKEKEVVLRNRKLTSSAVILSTGGQHKKLKVEGEEDFTGRGVSYCATCDGPFFRGRKVAVVGGGNMAVEDALYLSELASKTYLIAKSITAEEVVWARLRNSKVEEIKDSLSKISGADTVTSVGLASGRTIELDGIFICIGTTPSTELASKAGVRLDSRGFIQVNRDMETNVPGVFAAGDVTGGIPQVATAVGEGCTAAMRAYGYFKR